jgi:hypothetical protein
MALCESIFLPLRNTLRSSRLCERLGLFMAFTAELASDIAADQQVPVG